jgi:hypothetical protein
MPEQEMMREVNLGFDRFVRFQIVDEACPRYVTMMKPQHGMGHQIGTFTTTLITALFFNLTVADAPYRDDSESLHRECLRNDRFGGQVKPNMLPRHLTATRFIAAFSPLRLARELRRYRGLHGLVRGGA